MTAGVWLIGVEGHCMPVFCSQTNLSYLWLSGKPSLILVNPGYSIQIFNQINNIGTSFTCTNNEVALQKLYKPNVNYVYASCIIQTLDINGSYITVGQSLMTGIDI
jgi:hypothetical protein